MNVSLDMIKTSDSAEEFIKQCITGRELTKFKTNLPQIDSNGQQLESTGADDVDTGDLVGTAKDPTESIRKKR